MTNNYTVVLSKNKRNIRFLLVLFSFLVVLNLPFKYSFADFEKDRIEFIEACKNNVPEENLLIKPLENYIKPEALGAFKDYYKTFVTNKKALLLFCFEGHKLWQTFNGTLIQWQENIPTLAQSIINRIFLRGVRKMKGDETPPLFLYNAELANSNDTSLCKILLTGGPEADTQQLHMAMLNASMNVTSDVQVQYYKFATAAILKEVEEFPKVKK